MAQRLKGKGKVVAQGELAELFGTTTATVRNWQRAGCPVEQEGGKGRATRYNTARVFEWRLQLSLAETDLPLEEARRRKLAAEAKLSEIALEQKRGELVPLVSVTKHVEEAFSNYKRELLSIPARHGAQIAAACGGDLPALDRALGQVIREHLQALSAPIAR